MWLISESYVTVRETHVSNDHFLFYICSKWIFFDTFWNRMDTSQQYNIIENFKYAMLWQKNKMFIS